MFEQLELGIVSHVEELDGGLTVEWYGDFDLAVFTMDFKGVERHVIDRFAERVLRMIEEWPAGKPSRVVYRVLSPDWSTYARSRTQEIFGAVPPDMVGRMALILPQSPMSQILRLFFRKQFHQTFEVQSFMKLDKGMAWVAGTINVKA